MCDPSCIDFGVARLGREEVRGKAVIEVGALDVNGSLRAHVERLGPARYLGVDMAAGPGVDEVCNVRDLVARYGKESFDVVISTEMLEHVSDWRNAISNLKAILKPGGALLLTTRSKGFPYHGYPYDFWRYEVEDMRSVFRDMQVETIESDPLHPGVFVKAHKPADFAEASLEGIDLYSIVLRKRCKRFSEADIPVSFKLAWALRRLVAGALPAPLKDWLKQRLLRGGAA
jgi:SAM-dependent methyltransferase